MVEEPRPLCCKNQNSSALSLGYFCVGARLCVRVCVSSRERDQNEEAVVPFADRTLGREKLKINVSSYHP